MAKGTLDPLAWADHGALFRPECLGGDALSVRDLLSRTDTRLGAPPGVPLGTGDLPPVAQPTVDGGAIGLGPRINRMGCHCPVNRLTVPWYQRPLALSRHRTDYLFWSTDANGHTDVSRNIAARLRRSYLLLTLPLALATAGFCPNLEHLRA